MKDREKVSVLMSCYNSQETLKDSIKSILIQTYENFEFLIIDDNSCLLYTSPSPRDTG